MLGSTLLNSCPTLNHVTTLTGQQVDVTIGCVPQRLGSEVAEALPDFDAAGLATVFKALGSPIRLRLLAVMQAAPAGEACVCELVDDAGLAQSTVSHHLAVLIASGLVRRDRRGTWVWYAIVPDRLAAVRDVLARPGVLVD